MLRGHIGNWEVKMSQGQGCSIFTHSRCMKWRIHLDFQDVKEMKSQDSTCVHLFLQLPCRVNNMPKNVKKKKSQILTWIIPQPEDAVLHTLLSWLKEEALFGHHHSVPCILNRVEIGKFWHYGLKCGRGGWHRPPWIPNRVEQFSATDLVILSHPAYEYDDGQMCPTGPLSSSHCPDNQI